MYTKIHMHTTIANDTRLPGRRSAAHIMRTQSRGRGWVYVAPGCSAHPGGRTFWLGGVCKGRRA